MPRSALLFNTSLNGAWTFTLDPEDRGEAECWFNQTSSRTIQVPGSWEEQGFGHPPHSHLTSGWTKQTEYEGAAWYVRDINIPTDWNGRIITLTLKGVRWRSRLWIDGQYIGQRESLSVPHRYDLTVLLNPGSDHRLAIQVDNRMIYPLQESHINSLQTATHWGGITGGIELTARPPISIQY
jgi:beta-galactosidase/beta-glucuronidase